MISLTRITQVLVLAVLCFALAEVTLVYPLTELLGEDVRGTPVLARVRDLVRAVAWVVALLFAVVGAVWANATRDAPVEDARPRWLWGALNDLSEGIVAFGRDGRVVFANDAACKLLQRRSLPVGTPMIAFSDIPRLRTSLVRALLDREQVESELQTPGNRVLVAHCTPAAGDGALLLVLDVTAQREAIRAREAFLSDAAHELRTPITALLAGSEALGMMGIADEGAGIAEGMTRHAERLRSLFDDLLVLARVEGGSDQLEIEPVEVADAASYALDSLEDGVDRVTVTGEPELACMASSIGLERVLCNLLQNALRYSDGPVLLSWAMRLQRIEITVDDEGPGIPEAERERVFERFHRLDSGRDRASGGTGLGLPIVRELVERFGGEVHAEGREPTGARFVVRLPPAASLPASGGHRRPA